MGEAFSITVEPWGSAFRSPPPPTVSPNREVVTFYVFVFFVSVKRPSVTNKWPINCKKKFGDDTGNDTATRNATDK